MTLSDSQSKVMIEPSGTAERRGWLQREMEKELMSQKQNENYFEMLVAVKGEGKQSMVGFKCCRC